MLRVAAMSVLVALAAACSATPGANSTARPAATATSAVQPSLAGMHFTINVSSAGFLVDEAGKALYTFDNDTGTTSTCYDTCASSWPPAISPSNALPTAGSAELNGTLSTVARNDGAAQVTFKGDPLYYFAGDTAPGDTKGDGVGGVWHLARPNAAPSSPTGAPGSAMPTQSSAAPASSGGSGGGECPGYYCDDY